MLCLPCADMDTMAVLMPADRSAFSGTGASWIPPGSHGSSCWPGAAGPCSAQLLKPPSWFPAEKGSSALHHIQQVLPHPPTQLCHFQAFCWFCDQTGIVLRIKVNDSYSKLLLKEVLKNLRVCVIWAILRKWKKKKVCCWEQLPIFQKSAISLSLLVDSILMLCSL